ncbi:MAG TPA: 4Fe-4S dicluster domain-containing protein, partial [Acidobacteriota bacterium]|nr:4Fe-4S dicluster domain-containing protein [Acidobacteriota bacterium]
MSYYLATQKEIIDWIKRLSTENQLYFPEKHGQASYRFNRVGAGSTIQFENYTPTVVPPVKLLVPAREELLRFQKDADGKTEVQTPIDTSFRILAGVRPCDLKGIFLMDLFFKEGIADAYYLARRDNTAIIGHACPAECDPRAFCAAVDSLDHTEGADVFITPVRGRESLVEVKSALGEKITAGLEREPCADGAARRVGAVTARPEPFGRTFPVKATEIAKHVAAHYQSPVWEKHVKRCFSCGTCNLVCPTCYCFDVADDLHLDVASGNRTRTWDACMLPHFAEVG